MTHQIDYDELPVKYVMENDILSDIFYPNDTVKDKRDRVRNQLENSDSRDFFMVIVDEKTDKFLGIITFDEFMGLIDKKKMDYNKKFKEIMNKDVPYLNDKQTIKNVFDLFESKNYINVIPILNESGRYIGKVRRTNIKKRIDEFLKSFSD